MKRCITKRDLDRIIRKSKKHQIAHNTVIVRHIDKELKKFVGDVQYAIASAEGKV